MIFHLFCHCSRCRVSVKTDDFRRDRKNDGGLKNIDFINTEEKISRREEIVILNSSLPWPLSKRRYLLSHVGTTTTDVATRRRGAVGAAAPPSTLQHPPRKSRTYPVHVLPRRD